MLRNKKKLIDWDWFSLLMLALFLSVFYFSLAPGSVPSDDYMSNILLPYVFIKNFSFYLDDFEYITGKDAKIAGTLLIKNETIGSTDLFFAPRIHGHYVSAYPILTPLLASPIYLVLSLIVGSPSYDNIEALTLFGSAAGAILLAIAVCIMLVFFRKLNQKTTDYLVLVYAFGTLILPVSSTLNNHIAGLLFLPLAWFYALQSNEKKEGGEAGLSGLFAALAFMGRTTNVISYVVLFFYYILKKKNVKEYLAFSLPIFFVLLAYNYAIFGSPWTSGYDYQYLTLDGEFVKASFFFQLDAEFFNNFMALLISPNRGMFFYSPCLLFAIFGIWKAFKENDETAQLMRFITAAFFVTVAFFATWFFWTASHRYGYLILLDIVVYPMILISYASKEIFSNKTLLATLIIFGIVSIIVSVIGLSWGCEWSSNPNIDLYKERVWDLQDLEITRCFRNMIAN